MHKGANTQATTPQWDAGARWHTRAVCARLQKGQGHDAQVMYAPVLDGEDMRMERRTLDQIVNRTRSGDLVFYFHSKGVSDRRSNQEPGACGVSSDHRGVCCSITFGSYFLRIGMAPSPLNHLSDECAGMRN